VGHGWGQMDERVRYSTRDGVAFVTIDNPPVNAISLVVRTGLQEALSKALADAEVGAIVIAAQGPSFSAGADLRDLDCGAVPPRLTDLLRDIEDAPKPVLAAIQGSALGGGFELALACHYRLVHTDAQLGLPDMALGLVPSGGGSQRLVRLAGARVALDMLISGRPISAELAVRLGLADRLVRKSPGRVAFMAARNFIQAKTPPRPTRTCEAGFANPDDFLAAVEERRAAAEDDKREAVHRAIDLVEAALLLPFEAALAMEYAHFASLAGGAQAHGLRHAILAERRAARRSVPAGHPPRPVARVAVLGGGRLGSGIVRACLAAGLAVNLVERDEAAVLRARRRIASGIARDVAQGHLAPDQRAAQIALFDAGHDIAVLSAADLVLEAVGEDHETRRAMFARAGAASRPGTLLASAGLAPDLAALARASSRPADVLGLRFFTPARWVRLVEVVCPPTAAPDLAASGGAFARMLGKLPVSPDPSGDGDSLALPVFGALFAVAAGALCAGADPQEIDTALRDYGFALGPFQLADLAGIDRLAALGWPGIGGILLAEIMAAGFAGKEPGEGFYRHPAGAPARPAPELDALTDRLRKRAAAGGGWTGKPTKAEIADRAAHAMANAGARLLASEVARHPSDIDAAMLAGFTYPRWRGGPMLAADTSGLLAVRTRLRRLSECTGEALFAPSPLFDMLIRNGVNFEALNLASAGQRPV
jgi:3-hydroxyacyl-CoA dehydrogenase